MNGDEGDPQSDDNGKHARRADLLLAVTIVIVIAVALLSIFRW